MLSGVYDEPAQRTCLTVHCCPIGKQNESSLAQSTLWETREPICDFSSRHNRKRAWQFCSWRQKVMPFLILHLMPKFPQTHLECTAMTSRFFLGGANKQACVSWQCWIKILTLSDGGALTSLSIRCLWHACIIRSSLAYAAFCWSVLYSLHRTVLNETPSRDGPKIILMCTAQRAK